MYKVTSRHLQVRATTRETDAGLLPHVNRLAILTACSALPGLALAGSLLAQEPRGIRFNVHGGTHPYLVWDTPLEEAKELRPPGSSMRLIKDCTELEPKRRKIEGCTIGYGWRADFGDSEGWFDSYEFQTVLYFYDGRFFKYDITFRAAVADEVVNALKEALGPPTSEDTSSVVTAMGAVLDQIEVAWLMNETAVLLKKRDGDLTSGRLSTTYLPIASEEPQPPKIKAPF